ncbi:hypothetical protein JAAARDRAFT_131452 [Jaapia argillacea MUCL 33604]|uniref:Protein arginine methyltransferase NDUFAF7 n=1 Tax=Jaapia argillacea MUCL 33604 TaxID=933084 RepID=A0A067PQE9_9AGAM|nr:hypothetical protein JAAARDRAFT_131452 [Jaapia argillacea MUCL 33604]
MSLITSTLGRLSRRLPCLGSPCSPRYVRCYSATASILGTPPPPTKVEKLLLDTIKSTGPITFSTYMQLCLSHPTLGYYMNPANEIFGTRGDFITSPEISQVFGELVGVWLLSRYQASGQGRKIRLVELGPGRGTLMHDIIRTLSRFSFASTSLTHLHLIETSPPLQVIQEQKLTPSTQPLNIHTEWHGSIEDVPVDEEGKFFTMVVAHEFFDALPFHLFERTEQAWKELLITAPPPPTITTSVSSPHSLSTSTPPTTLISTNAPRLTTVSSPTPMSTLLPNTSPRFSSLPVGARIEVSHVGWKIAQRIGELIGGSQADSGPQTSSGCALIVDYGDDKAFGDSFRVRPSAFKNHKIVSPFHLPGESDLTLNVDFAYLKESISPLAKPLGPLTQSAFLNRMGLQARLQTLLNSAKSEDRASNIRTAVGRLVDESGMGMGRVYRILGVVGKEEVVEGQMIWPFAEEGGKFHVETIDGDSCIPP